VSKLTPESDWTNGENQKLKRDQSIV
jgi:hypothetical protein